MDILPVNAVTTGPQGLDALAASAASTPTQQTPQAQTGTPLEPAVKLDIGPNGGTGVSKARYVQDPETSSIVFQVVDPSSGNVIEQLPSEAALRNRAYDVGHSTHAAQSGNVSRIA